MLEDDRWQIIPYLRVSDGEAAIRFYRDVFGAIERFRVPMPDGTIGFAELDIHGTLLQLADADYATNKPLGGPVAISMHTRVTDVDAIFQAALAAGATAIAAPADDPHAGRRAMFTDPFAHHWTIAERVSMSTA
jgi:PhnB protein